MDEYMCVILQVLEAAALSVSLVRNTFNGCFCCTSQQCQSIVSQMWSVSQPSEKGVGTEVKRGIIEVEQQNPLSCVLYCTTRWCTVLENIDYANKLTVL